MDLYLSNHHKVRNTNYSTTSGQVVYKAETPGSIYRAHKTTTISKIIPNDSPDDMSTQPSVHCSSFLFIYRLTVNVVNTSWQVQRVSNDRMVSTQARFDNIWRNDNSADRIHAPYRHRANVSISYLMHLSTLDITDKQLGSTSCRTFTAPGDGRSFRWKAKNLKSSVCSRALRPSSAHLRH